MSYRSHCGRLFLVVNKYLLVYNKSQRKIFKFMKTVVFIRGDMFMIDYIVIQAGGRGSP